jgi:hypothetical protein
VVEEIASRVPMNAAQASLAGQVVVAQRLANAMATRAGAPGLATMEMVRLGRLADALIHTVTRLERALERRQFRVMPFRDVRPVDGADLAVLDRAWGRRAEGAVGCAGAPVVDGGSDGGTGGQGDDKGTAGTMVRGRTAAATPPAVTTEGGRAEMVVVDGVWCDRATGEPAAVWRGPNAAAGGGVAKEDVDAGTPAFAGAGRAGMTEMGREAGTGSEQRRSREGVTVEQGDGFTLEIWPAVTGADAGLAKAGRDTAGSRRGPGDRA